MPCEYDSGKDKEKEVAYTIMCTDCTDVFAEENSYFIQF